MKRIKNLERTMITYRDLLLIPVKECKEPLVYLDKRLRYGYLPTMNDMKKFTGKIPLVRKTVFNKLIKVQEDLSKVDSSLKLFITYGYRFIDIQTQRFLKMLRSKTIPFFENPAKLYEEIHRYVAVPTVAGHPTGGAVDITISNVSSNTFLDFGSQQYNYLTKKSYFYWPTLSRNQKNNRVLLRKIMMKQGFAPFDGEWWHFSYGDKEWAKYYDKPNAIYSTIYAK